MKSPFFGAQGCEHMVLSIGRSLADDAANRGVDRLIGGAY